MKLYDPKKNKYYMEARYYSHHTSPEKSKFHNKKNDKKEKLEQKCKCKFHFRRS